MASSNFVDYVKIYCQSGKGGAGSRHFRREKFVPRGGPDGGDGGRGGNVSIKGNPHMWTLLPLKFRKHVRAGDGEGGGASQRHGANGEDIVLEVPLGTIARNADTMEIIAEVNEANEEIIILAGGRGGLGNVNFKSSTNQAPKYAQPGEEGQKESLILELKLLADVGLVGFPNAGKSTLLAAVSAAKPKIADYPFTTMVPNLGIVSYHDNQSFVMADIPGIIEGAAEGKGLGLRFLRHIERNSVLLFIVGADEDDPAEQYRILLKELEKYTPELLDKPRMIGISKYDLIDEEIEGWIAAEMPKDIPYVFFSAVTGYNIDKLKDALWVEINASVDDASSE